MDTSVVRVNTDNKIVFTIPSSENLYLPKLRIKATTNQLNTQTQDFAIRKCGAEQISVLNDTQYEIFMSFAETNFSNIVENVTLQSWFSIQQPASGSSECHISHFSLSDNSSEKVPLTMNSPLTTTASITSN